MSEKQPEKPDAKKAFREWMNDPKMPNDLYKGNVPEDTLPEGESVRFVRKPAHKNQNPSKQ